MLYWPPSDIPQTSAMSTSSIQHLLPLKRSFWPASGFFCFFWEPLSSFIGTGVAKISLAVEGDVGGGWNQKMTGYQPGIVWILKRTQGRIQMSGLHSSDTQWTAITETERWFLHHESVSDCQCDQGTSLSRIAMYSFYRSPQALNIGTCLTIVMECHASIHKCFQVSACYKYNDQWIQWMNLQVCVSGWP